MRFMLLSGGRGRPVLRRRDFPPHPDRNPLRPDAREGRRFFRYEPRTEKLDIFVSYSFANPWGINWDHWGQTFIADASGGANYFATAFSGDLDYPRKHPNLKQFWSSSGGRPAAVSLSRAGSSRPTFRATTCSTTASDSRDAAVQDVRRGSGFHADPVEPLLRSSDPNFRPVDLQFGPDGTLFICDWFNPLVGHMQHSIRDPNRDHNHGRIWRFVYRKNPLLTPPKIEGASIESLIALLKEPEYRTRYRVRRELRGRDTEQVLAALDRWTGTLDVTKPDEAHLLLEALWVKQHHDAVDPVLLGKLLNGPEPRARAAAVRVLCYWRDRVPDVLKLLQARVNDEHPRVRLEAVRALSFFNSPQALEIAVESLVYDQDAYLEYTLKETMTTLEARIKK